MQTVASVAVFLLPLLARAGEVQHTVEYRMESYSTVMQVLTPAGARCHVASDNPSWMPGQDFEVPFKLTAQAGYYHTFDCKLPDGRAWRQRLDPKPNHTTIIRIDPSGAVAPAAVAPNLAAEAKKVAMGKEEFAKLATSLAKEAFDDNRLGVVRVAAKSHYFSAEQIKVILGAFPHSDDKVGALRLLAKRLVDEKNSHTILSSFTFDDDKEQAAEILGSP